MVEQSSPIEPHILDLPTRTSRDAFSLRASFATFAAVVCIAIITVFVVDAVHERTIATRVARQAAENLAESLAQQASDTFDSAHGALSVVAKRVGRDGLSRRAEPDLSDLMKALVATLPRIHLMVVFDPAGECVAMSVARRCLRHTPSVGDRPYFRYHRDHPDLGMSISGPARGRFDKTEEIFASIRLERPDGSFAGVALAPVLTSFFERSFVNVDVGQHGNITLFRDDGTILARKPPIFLGVQFPQAALLAGSRRAMEGGSYMTSAAADGNAHLFAFRHVRGYPLIIRVGVAENEYLADWIADTEKKGIGAVVILIIVVILAVSLDRQIGQRKLAEIRLAELALLDGLTGLANRRLFDEVLDREWRQAGRSRTSIALLMIDVDYFKAYNDFYGHHAGDKILIQIAQTIAADLKRPGDLVARYGGEEFVVILPAADVRSALTVAERIREVISGLHVAHAPAESGMLSVSIGLAAFVPSRRGAATDLIEAADAALYDAKRTGRNRVAVSSRSEAYERSD